MLKKTLKMTTNVVLSRHFDKPTRMMMGSNNGFLISIQKRRFGILWSWLNFVFNSVDRKRLKLLGPDRTCAEWLLRNGAEVRFKGQQSLINDYNELMVLEELEESVHYRVEEIYARKAGLSQAGFDHLKNCGHVKKITLDYCIHIDDRCLYKLEFVKDSLQFLEIRSCFQVTDKGVQSLRELRNLNKLILGNLPAVENKAECKAALEKALKNCDLSYD